MEGQNNTGNTKHSDGYLYLGNLLRSSDQVREAEVRSKEVFKDSEEIEVSQWLLHHFILGQQHRTMSIDQDAQEHGIEYTCN